MSVSLDRSSTIPPELRPRARLFNYSVYHDSTIVFFFLCSLLQKLDRLVLKKMRFSQCFVALAMALSGAEALTINSDSCLSGMSCFLIRTCEITY